MSDDKAPSADNNNKGKGGTRLEWDDSKMSTSYANVANAASTREEVALVFGTNQTWKPTEGAPVRIELTNRVILSPYAAKRFSLLLDSVLEEYESRFGELKVDAATKGSDA